MTFQINSLKSEENIYSLSDIYKIALFINKKSEQEKIDLFVIVGEKSTQSLVIISALLISKKNFLVTTEQVLSNIDFKEKNLNIHIFNNKYDYEGFFNNIKKNYLNSNISTANLNNAISDCFSNTERQIFYSSSGSTGSPKLIPINSKMLYKSHKKVISLIKKKESLKNVLCIHSTSFVISLNYIMVALLLDIRIVSILPLNFLSLISKIKSIGNESILITVPSMLDAIKDYFIRKPNLKLHSLISCGEPLKISVAEKIIPNSINGFYNFFGATEFATWVFSLEINRKLLKKLKEIGSIYIPLGNPLEAVDYFISENKELFISSEHMTNSYLDQKLNSYNAKILSLKNKKFLSVGDCIKNQNGYLLPEGRTDSLRKIRGIFVDIFNLQKILIERFENIEFLVVINKSNIVLIIYSGNNLNKLENFEVEKTIIDIIKTYLLEDIPRKLICETSGLRKNNSFKVDRAYYINLD